MLIRKATSADMPAILKLINEYPDELMQDNLPPADAFFVATEGERIIGCCAMEIYSKRLAEIRSLAVTRSFQRKGIAKQLIQTCVTEAKQGGVYEILCITGTQGVFEKYGFGPFNKEKFALIKILRNEL